MKKYFLMMVMLFTMSMYSYAVDTSNVKISNIEKYDLKVNLRRLGTFLDLNSYQIDGVTSIETEFQNDLMFIANEGTDDNRNILTKNAIKKHIQHMRYVLDGKQMHKYLVVLNATIKNKELLNDKKEN